MALAWSLPCGELFERGHNCVWGGQGRRCPVWMQNGEQGCTPVEGVIRELGMHSGCGWGRPLQQPSMPALPADFSPFSIEPMPL